MTGELMPGARQAIKMLGNWGLRTTILSGDHNEAVATVARQTGVSEFAAELTPQQKVAALENPGEPGCAMMVGDGLNDAPCLAAAHVSMAPASATDVSRAGADFVYTRNSLFAVPFAFKLARATRRVVSQNFAIAILYNCIAVPLAMLGHVTPLVAAIAMSLSSVVVVSNSLRLLAFSVRFPVVRSGAAEQKSHQPADLIMNEGLS